MKVNLGKKSVATWYCHHVHHVLPEHSRQSSTPWLKLQGYWVSAHHHLGPRRLSAVALIYTASSIHAAFDIQWPLQWHPQMIRWEKSHRSRLALVRHIHSRHVLATVCSSPIRHTSSHALAEHRQISRWNEQPQDTNEVDGPQMPFLGQGRLTESSKITLGSAFSKR